MRLVFFILLFPCAVAAQVFDVYSGEHGDFTRLYVRKGLENEYSVHQNGRTVEVSFRKDNELNISNIWERISRNRIGRVWQEGRSLFIDMNCDCSLIHINDRNRGIIIDFYGPESVTPPAVAISHPPPFLQKTEETPSTWLTLSSGAPMGGIAYIMDRGSLPVRNWAITRSAQFLASNLAKKASRSSIETQALSSEPTEEQCPDVEDITPDSWGVGTDYLTAKRAAWERISLEGEVGPEDFHQLVRPEQGFQGGAAAV